MSAAQFVAEFRALSPHQRDGLLRLMPADRELREDLQDCLAIEQRRSEPAGHEHEKASRFESLNRESVIARFSRIGNDASGQAIR